MAGNPLSKVSSTPTNFTCTTCKRVSKDRSLQQPPRKRVRLNPSAKRKSSESTQSPRIVSGTITNHYITKRDAVNALRERNPNDQWLSDLLDRYLNKNASREERELVKQRIQDVARDLLENSFGGYASSISPPKPISNSISFEGTGTTSNSVRGTQGAATHSLDKLTANVSISKILPRASAQRSKKVSKETRKSPADSRKSSPLADSAPPLTKSCPQAKVVDLTNDTDEVVEQLRQRCIPVASNSETRISESLHSSGDPFRQAQLSTPHRRVQDEDQSTLRPIETAAVHSGTGNYQKSEQHKPNDRLKDLWLRIEELELIKESGYETINGLRTETSRLKAQLSLAKQQLRLTQPIETSIPGDRPTINLPMRNSQGDNPPVILSPESENHSPMVHGPAQFQPKHEDDHTQAKLFKAEMTVQEQQQKIMHLERELEAVKAGKRMHMSRIAHTNIVDGTPTGLPKIVPGEEPRVPHRVSRKQALSQINLHRATESRTKLYAEPIRWNVRDQSGHFRPNVQYSGLDASDDENRASVHLNGKLQDSVRQAGHMLNSPATSSSGSSNNDEMTVSDDKSISTGSPSEDNIPAAASDSKEIANSSYEGDSAFERGGTQGTRGSLDEQRDNVHEESKRTRAPEAVRAADTFERAFEIEPGAMPVVMDSKLVFHTGERGRNTRPRAAQNSIYRVGRDVLGEMR